MKVFAISDLHLGTIVDKPMDIFDDKWQDYWKKVETDWNNKVSDDFFSQYANGWDKSANTTSTRKC